MSTTDNNPAQEQAQTQMQAGSLHLTTFGYLRPTEQQMEVMNVLRSAVADYAFVLEEYLPPGPDKTYIMRRLREVAMWANACTTRHADGSPRS